MADREVVKGRVNGSALLEKKEKERKETFQNKSKEVIRLAESMMGTVVKIWAVGQPPFPATAESHISIKIIVLIAAAAAAVS